MEEKNKDSIDFKEDKLKSEINQIEENIESTEFSFINKSGQKKKIDIVRKNDYIYLYYYPEKDKVYKKKLIKKFEHDDKIKVIKNFNKQNKANEESIRKYFMKQSKEEYIPTSEEDFKEQLKKIKRDKDSKIKYFLQDTNKEETRLVFSPTKIKNIDFDYMYISVNVRVYLDGFYTDTVGRSDYFYTYEWTNDKGRTYNSFENGIPKDKISESINQAVLRAIALYGSNVKFKILSWHYAYHQRIGEEY